jgi:hypothetical protein
MSVAIDLGGFYSANAHLHVALETLNASQHYRDDRTLAKIMNGDKGATSPLEPNKHDPVVEVRALASHILLKYLSQFD